MTQAAHDAPPRGSGFGRLWAYLDYLVFDHAMLRLVLPNAHRVSAEMIRAGQPWEFQLRRWRDQGVKSVVSLRGCGESSFHRIEREACGRLGLELHEFSLSAIAAPSPAQVLAAKHLFDLIRYPALVHCKSGADRAGLMSTFYSHFRMGEPIASARRHLSLRYGHTRMGRAGVLDFVFDRYQADAATSGESFLEWVTSQRYDPARIEFDFKERRRRAA